MPLLKIRTMILFILALFLPVASFANPGVATDGGLQVGASDDPYWFNLSGVVKLDTRLYYGNTQRTAQAYNPAGSYNSGTFIRDAGLTVSGGVGKLLGGDITYALALDFDANGNSVSIDDAYLMFHGFKHLMPNFTFSIGQVNPGFCLSCAMSSKWIPFMERSMGTNTFGPQIGMGISANTYNEHYSATVAITQQPRSGRQLRNVNGNTVLGPDLWQASGRLTYAPISSVGRVLQFGFSAHILGYNNNGLQFAAIPEMRSGCSRTLLNTTSYINNSNTQLWILAHSQTTIDFEILAINGPWSGEIEYQRAYVNRGRQYGLVAGTQGVKQGPNLQFSGYNMQVSYILTGETRPLKQSNGTLGQIKPKSKCGAWEVSARYSFITLNDKDIQGGMAHNMTGSLSWYANNNVKVIGEYVYSLQRRLFTTSFPNYLDKRHVSGVGARLQIVF